MSRVSPYSRDDFDRVANPSESDTDTDLPQNANCIVRVLRSHDAPAYFIYSATLALIQVIWMLIGVFLDSSVFSGSTWFAAALPFYMWIVESMRFVVAKYDHAMRKAVLVEERADNRLRSALDSARRSATSSVESAEREHQTTIIALTLARYRRLGLLLLELLLIACTFTIMLMVLFNFSRHHYDVRYILVPVVVLAGVLLVYELVYYRVIGSWGRGYNRHCCYGSVEHV